MVSAISKALVNSLSWLAFHPTIEQMEDCNYKLEHHPHLFKMKRNKRESV